MADHPKLAAFKAELAAAPKAAELRTKAIVDFIAGPIDDLIDAIGIDAFCVELGNIYDIYIEPQDIPWIPGLVESYVDKAIKGFLIGLVRRLHDKIHTP